MNPQVFGPEHLTYVIVSLLVAAVLVFEYDEPNRKKRCSKV
jgi:hypothetical protein